MARYRVVKKCWLNLAVHEEGAEVEYDGTPGSALVLIEEPKATLRVKPKDDAALA